MKKQATAAEEYETLETKLLPIELLEVNRGQIYGLSENPRFIRDERFEALKKSISDNPEMMKLRELIVYPFNEKFVTIGGNMRLRACIALGFKEVPCKVLPFETPAEALRAYTIKDNVGFGENDWDALANDWNPDELKDFGMNDGFLNADQNIDDFFDEEQAQEGKDDGQTITVSVPKDVSVDEVRAAIEEAISGFGGVKIK